MKKKPMRILFSFLLVAVLTTAFSMTAFAAGDVAGNRKHMERCQGADSNRR
jgi:hypothetical protein